MSPIRPSFREGARLSAGQLNATVKYLRDSLRRFSLAPFSPGVAAGLRVSAAGSTLTVEPGVAVDGRGRLLVLETQLRYTLNETGDLFLEGGGGPPVAHFVPGGTTLFVLRIEYRESGDASGVSCEAGTTFGIQEGVRLTFEQATSPEESTAAFLQLFSEGCVDPWSDMDGVSAGSCAVQLGTVALIDEPPLLASMFFRQGMSARLSLVRSSLGVPSIAIGKLPIGNTQVDAVVFPVPAGGPVVQASHVGAFGKLYGAGAYYPDDDRVFIAGGGSGVDTPLPAGFGGVVAVPCDSAEPHGTFLGPGIPVSMAPPVAGFGARVKAFDPGDPGSALLGITAGRDVVFGGRVVVPVAVAGLLQLPILNSGTAVSIGSPVRVLLASGLYGPATASGQYVVARAAAPLAEGATVAFAWVVHPPVPLP